MKKNKLIEMLQAIPGNPEIKLYNGFVEDWQDFTVDEDMLIRYTREAIARRVVFDELKGREKYPSEAEIQDMTKKCLEDRKDIKAGEWRLRGIYDTDETIKLICDTKKIYIIQAKKQNKSTFDRMGNIYY